MLWVWGVYCAAAWVCMKHLNERAELVPRRGEWWDSSAQPYVLLQVRAFLSGRLALVKHPWLAGHDYDWGRGGMHQAWGLGLPILATPFHIVGRWLGAPGFPDALRFLVLYMIVAVVLARALHRVSRDEPNALVVGTAAAGFVMSGPTLVGLLSARFLIYDQTIATGALWSVLLLAGILALLRKPTGPRLFAVCAGAGFAILIRPPIAVYGGMTFVLALFIAWRGGASRRALVLGVGAYLLVTALYFAGNAARFGSVFATGYENTISGAFVNRMTRWGIPFNKVPFRTQAKEMFATLFFLDPVPYHIMMGAPPPSIAKYVVGERWREYYAPTYDVWTFWVWAIAVVVVVYKVLVHRLWRSEADLRGEAATIVGVWAIPPSIVLFVFYARIGNFVTRYATDMYPAFAGAALCVGMALAAAVRVRRPLLTPSVQVAIAACLALYIDGWRGWVTQISRPLDRNGVVAKLADIDARADQPGPPVPDHFKCHEARGPSPVHTHLEDWRADCTFASGMVFAMRYSPCVTFTFQPAGAAWTPADDDALTAFRGTGDFDSLVTCGPPQAVGEAKRVTLCEPHKPHFVLDGLRLYSIASLDPGLVPMDRLRLTDIDSAPACR